MCISENNAYTLLSPLFIKFSPINVLLKYKQTKTDSTAEQSA